MERVVMHKFIIAFFYIIIYCYYWVDKEIHLVNTYEEWTLKKATRSLVSLQTSRVCYNGPHCRDNLTDKRTIMPWVDVYLGFSEQVCWWLELESL